MIKKITLRAVALEAGVAESTASRALQGGGQLSEATRARVALAAEKLGYALPQRPLAANHSARRRGVVGVVVAALHNSFYPYLVDRLHNELDELGFDVILIIDDITRDRAGRKLRALIDTLDGVIVTTAMIGSPTIDFLIERQKPTVLAIRSNMRDNVDVVESDNFAAGSEALKHLIALGHRNIGFLMGPKSTSTSYGHLEGARAALADANLSLPEDKLFHVDFTHESGYSGFVQLLRRDYPPTAVFCGNDVIAIGALDAARKMNLSVPQDVSIVGVDNIPMASWSTIALTTVHQSIGEIGSTAAKLISEAISDQSHHNQAKRQPRKFIFPTSLIQRNTTGFCPA